MRTQKVFRRLHYWGAAIAGIPVLVILATGMVLQLKKNLTWVMPVEVPGSAGLPGVTFERLLAIGQSIPEAEIRTWDDIPRLEGRPQKGLIKLVSTNGHEIQIDVVTGDVLNVGIRRSDWIESIHDGSFFHDKAKLWIFFPAGVILFGLWCTGLYLFLLPFISKRRHRRRLAGAA
jgi:4-amino-4-deoxy-L-arabinose transferase-like glycosyltransferase